MEKSSPRFVWHYIKIFKWQFMLLAGCVMVRNFADATQPYFLAKIYGIVAEKNQGDYWSEIINYASLLAIISLISLFISESSMFIIARFLPKAKTMVIRDVFYDVNKQSISYFNNERRV